jgi:hypothetical protein
MRSAGVTTALLAGLMLGGASGCYHTHSAGLLPPPPAYACDGYGWGMPGYGDYDACLPEAFPISHRGRPARRAARHGHHGHHGPTYKGLPLVAAYIVPLNGSEFAGSADHGGFPCGECGPCAAGVMPGGWSDGGMSPSGGCGPDGCGLDAGWQIVPDGQMMPYNEMVPSEAYPERYQQNGDMLQPIPVPPAEEEGPWEPPASQPSAPRTTPEIGSEARLPAQHGTWLPAGLR